ncbi:hypothetical protein C2869_03050 [Saccharobesus litoralis]|uniref:Uncharacterized protein n=1 Tax=Saccharobesus litoralis TaxID=2172099 RepID=A0A2S0VMM8_9ALTE|nr:hypothetical protein C2869_03050 [Saccharobesus litoralis]
MLCLAPLKLPLLLKLGFWSLHLVINLAPATIDDKALTTLLQSVFALAFNKKRNQNAKLIPPITQIFVQTLLNI